jgi:hypothetical protein
MGRFILKSSTLLLLLFLFLCCTDKRAVNYSECSPFAARDVWYVEEFEADPHPSVIPLEENVLISSLVQEYYEWEASNEGTLILTGKHKRKIVLNCKRDGDTLVLYQENDLPNKLIIQNETANNLSLELIGLFHANLELSKKNE